jgi:hypothetical protein
MENLHNETVRCLHENGKKGEDVLFVTDGTTFCSWETFKENSKFSYDDGYGGNEIDLQLKIVGEGGWLERSEYDGSEWWTFKTLPCKPKTQDVPHIRQRER